MVQYRVLNQNNRKTEWLANVTLDQIQNAVKDWLKVYRQSVPLPSLNHQLVLKLATPDNEIDCVVSLEPQDEDDDEAHLLNTEYRQEFKPDQEQEIPNSDVSSESDDEEDKKPDDSQSQSKRGIKRKITEILQPLDKENDRSGILAILNAYIQNPNFSDYLRENGFSSNTLTKLSTDQLRDKLIQCRSLINMKISGPVVQDGAVMSLQLLETLFTKLGFDVQGLSSELLKQKPIQDFITQFTIEHCQSITPEIGIAIQFIKTAYQLQKSRSVNMQSVEMLD